MLSDARHRRDFPDAAVAQPGTASNLSMFSVAGRDTYICIYIYMYHTYVYIIYTWVDTGPNIPKIAILYHLLLFAAGFLLEGPSENHGQTGLEPYQTRALIGIQYGT